MNELDWRQRFQINNLNSFYQFIKDYDDEMSQCLKLRGYTCKGKSQRTVIFTFGEVTFRRNRWYKNGKCYIPVDEKLNLKKNERYSKELLFQIANLSRKLSYRQVVDVVEQMYHVYITKDTVLKARKLVTQLLVEREDYRFFEEEKQDKIKADIIYIEGDGIWLKTSDSSCERHNIDVSHFVIHTGSYQMSQKRFILQNKKEFVALSSHLARKQVQDYIYNHYEITDDTLLITNSDGGRGYTPYIFKELGKSLGFKRHEHFWDRYHLYQDVKLLTRRFDSRLKNSFYQAFEKHSRKDLIVAFDTLESLVDDQEELERVRSYREKFLSNFQYTKKAEQRGLPDSGLGIIESQHRKITYRMKHRGMYWSREGALTMANMIVLSYEKGLRDLFFGEWRELYSKYTEYEDYYLPSKTTKKEYTLPILKRLPKRK